MKFKTKRAAGFLLIAAVSMTLLMIKPFEVARTAPEVDETFYGVIEKIGESVVMEEVDSAKNIQHLQVRVKNEEGKLVNIDDDGTFLPGGEEFYVGQRLIVAENGQGQFYIKDLVRSKAIYWLFAIFVGVVILVTGFQGVGSLLGMVFSFIVLFQMVLPGILVGQNPLLMSILGASLIIPGTFFLSHGFSRKTAVAILGTLVALLATGVLSLVWAKWATLSGLSAEEASFLQAETKKVVDFRGLLLAGMVISVLGIMDDITISQSSIVQQLINAKKKIGFYELYMRAMRVGRDHIASMVNTLVLVYAGASLALLLLFIDYNQNFLEVLNYEFMAQEVIQTLVGSIGLVLAVPFTTLIACLILRPGDDEGEDHSGCAHVH